MENKKVVEIMQLQKTYKDFWGREKVCAVHDLSFDVNQGEIFGLLGPNGAGKTTTIKLLLGLLFPTKGKVTIFNKSPHNMNIKARIGFLPEESYLYPYQNAEEALLFYGKLFNLPHKICQKRVNDLLEMVGLEKARKRFIKEYSKGMARRIGIAQSLINDPEFIILDEPTSGLDPIGTKEIKDLILELKKHGKTILLCSHLLSDVEDVCDRVCILYNGYKICEGAIHDLLANDDVTQVTSEKLNPVTQEKLTKWFQKEGVKIHDLGNQKQRLESFFLQEIEKARVQIAHQTSQRKIKDFVAEVRKTSEEQNVLDKLVKKEELPSAQIEKEEEQPKEESKSSLENLLKKQSTTQDEPEKSTEKVEIDTNLLDSLTKKKEQK